MKYVSVIGFEGSRSRKAIAFINDKSHLRNKSYSTIQIEPSKTNREFSEADLFFFRNTALLRKGESKWKK